jgi:hypothetical protein
MLIAVAVQAQIRQAVGDNASGGGTTTATNQGLNLAQVAGPTGELALAA